MNVNPLDLSLRSEYKIDTDYDNDNNLLRGSVENTFSSLSKIK